MKHFTIEELCRSDYAKRVGLANTPSAMVTDNLEWLINRLLDPVREKWGKAIVVNSGFRNEYLNKQLNGVKHSQHLLDEVLGSVCDNCRSRGSAFCDDRFIRV